MTSILDQIREADAKALEARRAAIKLRPSEPAAPVTAQEVQVLVQQTDKPAEAPVNTGRLSRMLGERAASPMQTVMGKSLSAQLAERTAGVKAPIAQPVVVIPPAAQTPAPAMVAVSSADELQAAQAKLRQDLDFLEANMGGPLEQIRSVVRDIYVQQRARPDLSIIMTDKDYELTVKGLKLAYGHVKMKKTEKTAKATRKRTLKDEVATSLADFGFMDLSGDD